MLVDIKKLKQYIANDMNVLFEGERGVGKTATIYSAFKESGHRIKYFSAPTMDPWTDLIGIPTNVTRKDGKEVLRMIPPEDFADDNYDVIFIDELNRAPTKVLNALMELIQFGTINGKSYKIKMIWAAINPFEENGDYTVEKLDIAIKDRFHVHIKVPYLVDRDLFKKDYGSVGEVFADWWTNQPADVKKEISPRRLHGAAKFYLNGGEPADMLYAGNIDKLKIDLKNSTHLQILTKDFEDKVIKQSKNILLKDYTEVVANYLKNNQEAFEFFFNEISSEWLSKEFHKGKEVYKNIIEMTTNSETSKKQKADELVESIVQVAGRNSSLVRSHKEDLLKYFPPEEEKNITKDDFEDKFKIPSMNKLEKETIKSCFGSLNFSKNAAMNSTQIKERFEGINFKKAFIKIDKFKEANPDKYNKIVDSIAFRAAAILEYHIKFKEEQSKPISQAFKTIEHKLTDPTVKIYPSWQIVPQIKELITEYRDIFKYASTDEVEKLYNEMSNSKVAQIVNATTGESTSAVDTVSKVFDKLKVPEIDPWSKESPIPDDDYIDSYLDAITEEDIFLRREPESDYPEENYERSLIKKKRGI